MHIVMYRLGAMSIAAGSHHEVHLRMQHSMRCANELWQAAVHDGSADLFKLVKHPCGLDTREKYYPHQASKAHLGILLKSTTKGLDMSLLGFFEYDGRQRSLHIREHHPSCTSQIIPAQDGLCGLGYIAHGSLSRLGQAG